MQMGSKINKMKKKRKTFDNKKFVGLQILIKYI